MSNAKCIYFLRLHFFFFFLFKSRLTSLFWFSILVSVLQEKEIYRWPIRESLKSMLAMGWSIDRTKDGESMSQQRESEKMRKISQASQVSSRVTRCISTHAPGLFSHSQKKIQSNKTQTLYIVQANGFNPSPVDMSNVVLSRELQVGELT